MTGEFLADESIRHWIWWTVIPLAVIFGYTMICVADSKRKKCEDEPNND